MIYKIANIFSKSYDNQLNKYVVDAILSKNGRCIQQKLYFAFKEDAEQLKIGGYVEIYQKENKSKK